MYWKISRIGSFFLLSLCDVWSSWVWKSNIVNLSLSPFWFVLFVRSLSTLRSERRPPVWAAGSFWCAFHTPLLCPTWTWSRGRVGIQFLFSFLTYQLSLFLFQRVRSFHCGLNAHQSPVLFSHTCWFISNLLSSFSAYWSCPLKLIKEPSHQNCVWPLLCCWGLEQCEAGKWVGWINGFTSFWRNLCWQGAP